MTGRRAWSAFAVVCATAVLVSCAPAAAPPVTPSAPSSPRFPAFVEPVVPARLQVAPDVGARHVAAWRMLQSGDTRAAGREFSALLRVSPEFYPADAALGYVRLAERQPEAAVPSFKAAAAANGNYLPAWSGLADAHLALDQDEEAIAALERVVAIDPSREDSRSRLDLLKFRQVPRLISAGLRAREAGDHAEARRVLTRALGYSPTSGVILRELALAELDAGALVDAERHARRAVEVDADDPLAHATLAAVLESAGNLRGAAAAYGRAAALDPRSEWRARADALRERTEAAAVPVEFKLVPTAATVTRAQVAAYTGMRLETILARAPARVSDVATDVRSHWASRWVLPITRAGVMEILPNHTFQPSAVVRRSELAGIVARLLPLVPGLQTDLTRWRAARPRFADLPATHVAYPAVAVAVASGAMKADTNRRFDPAGPASGPDLVAAIARLEQMGGR